MPAPGLLSQIHSNNDCTQSQSVVFFLQLMFSVPYNLHLHDAYFAIGISELYLNTSGLFSQIYYYQGPYSRAEAGQMVEFEGERGEC